MSNNIHDHLNINHLSIFSKIAEYSSLTEASKYLRQDKGQLSRILQSLENEIGVTLVHRTTREFHLTQDGLRLYLRCKEIFGRLEEAVFEVNEKREEPEGKVKMTAAHGLASQFLPEIVAFYHQSFPKVSIEVYFSQDTVRVDHEEIDLALRFGNLKDSRLKIRRLGEFESNFFATPQFLASRPKLKTLKDIMKHPCFTLSHLHKKKIVFKKKKTQEALLLDGVILSNSPDFILDITLRAKGIGLIPKSLCKSQLLTGELKLLFPEWKTPGTPLNLVSPSGRKLSPHAKHFSDFLYDHIKKLSDT